MYRIHPNSAHDHISFSGLILVNKKIFNLYICLSDTLNIILIYIKNNNRKTHRSSLPLASVKYAQSCILILLKKDVHGTTFLTSTLGEYAIKTIYGTLQHRGMCLILEKSMKHGDHWYIPSNTWGTIKKDIKGKTRQNFKSFTHSLKSFFKMKT